MTKKDFIIIELFILCMLWMGAAFYSSRMMDRMAAESEANMKKLDSIYSKYLQEKHNFWEMKKERDRLKENTNIKTRKK